MKCIKFFFLLCLLGLIANIAMAQTAPVITLNECQQLARENYPLNKQKNLIAESRDLTLNNNSRALLPQINLYGQATYQSDVTRVPIKVPNQEIPTLSKDQYRVYLELNQSLFDGGVNKLQRQSIETSALVEDQKLEVELYQLKDRINQLYFGLLLTNDQLKLLEVFELDIQAMISKTQAAIEQGISMRSNLEVLQVELLKTGQRKTELTYTRSALLEMLSLLTGKVLDEKTVLEIPLSQPLPSALNRPELKLFEAQNKELELKQNALSIRKLPRLNFFVQTGLGRPALNMLSNQFDPYAIGGIRLNWNLSNFYTLKTDKALVDIGRSSLAIQKENFIFNTEYRLKQENREILKLKELLSSDEEIISLRDRIKNTSAIQLENGIIPAADYLREAYNVDGAKQNKALHELQLRMAEYKLLNTTGN